MRTPPFFYGLYLHIETIRRKIIKSRSLCVIVEASEKHGKYLLKKRGLS